MARLYDRVMAEGVESVLMPEARKNPPVVCVIDNVAEHWYDRMPGDWSYSDFPNVAPPFESLFAEYRYHGRSWGKWPSRWGFLMVASRGDEARELLKGSTEWRDATKVNTDDAEWCLLADAFCQADRRRPPVWAGYVVAAVRADGTIPEAWDIAAAANPNNVDPGASGDIGRAALPVLLAISFMHCKNVEHREVSPPKPLDKKWQKKGNKPLVRYHVLDIDPMRKVLRDEGRSEETGLKKALHICRGHFAHYPDGLFGRGAPETVWRPQHIRGNAKEGLVLKDYNVKAPEDGPTP